MPIISTNNRHSIRPSLNLNFAGSKKMDPRITFNRDSVATYYDGFTKIREDENLITYSQENFRTSPWSSWQVTETDSDTTAPDGTTTASTITHTGSSTTNTPNTRQGSINLNGVYTISAYVKHGTEEEIELGVQDYDGTSVQVKFDLVSVTVTSETNGTGSIVSVGNDWYRISVTTVSLPNATYNDAPYIAMKNSDDSNFSAASGTYFYLWGVQLEQRDFLTAYVPTTDKPIRNSIYKMQTADTNIPRFDHNPTTGESLGYLAEEARTNYLVYSNLSNLANTYGTTTQTNAVKIDPTGKLNANVIEASGNWARTTTVNGLTNGVTYTISMYVKADSATTISINLYDGATSSFNSKNVTTEWTRIEDTFTLNNNNTYLRVGLSSQTGTKKIYFAMGQVEAGSFSTSFIETYGSTKTRYADVAQIEAHNFNDGNWYTDGKGTLYAEYIQSKDGFSGITALRPSSGSSRISFIQTGLTSLETLISNEGTTIAQQFESTGTVGNVSKLALSYKNNSINSSFNGNIETEDTNGVVPIRLNILEIARYGGNYLNSHLKKLAYYPEALSRDEIQDLTEE